MDHAEKALVCWGFLAGMAAVVLIFFVLGGSPGQLQREWQTDAVMRGYAEYYLDKDNEKQWRWLESEKEMKK